MGRNLVLCFDGTNNEFGPENANVVRLAQSLVRSPRDQRMYYDPGVGTLPEPGAITGSAKRVSEWFGLAFGAGLMGKVERAYVYLMDFWEPGDQVFLVGFSRGAYTSRVLAAMLHALGLVPPSLSFHPHLGPGSQRLPDRLCLARRESPLAPGELWDGPCEYPRPLGEFLLA